MTHWNLLLTNQLSPARCLPPITLTKYATRYRKSPNAWKNTKNLISTPKVMETLCQVSRLAFPFEKILLDKKKLTFSAGKNQQSASKGKVPLLQITSPKFDESEENHVVEQSPLENSARKELKTMLKAINKTENSYPNSANGSAKRDIPLPSNAPANHRKNQVSATSISQENQSILSKQSKETGLGTTGCNSRASIVTSQKEVLQQKNQSNTSDSFTRPKSRSASKKSAEKNNQESLSPTRGKENKENFSNSANNQQIPPNKIATLEFRLVGANKTIKSMEKELKMKDDKIQELLKEIEKKNRLFEMLQVRCL